MGTVMGNLALTHMTTGGVFLIGGAARMVASHLLPLGFPEYFTAKGPYTPILQAMPLTLITDDHAALSGCARYLRQNLK